uniref:Clathrin/coatomer adaptor adaptin-like N-terminal domain-containing protein n=1 Tax=Parascaris equorum TaxID=6256 RepID=A0A914R0P5_PAREQ
MRNQISSIPKDNGKLSAHLLPQRKYFFVGLGEIFELKNELNSDKKEKKREAVKKVIASMTVGKDVSALFPDVVNCMQTDNVELKKLVYLYLMNYAKSQPDLAIMAVNTFVKVSFETNDRLLFSDII